MFLLRAGLYLECETKAIGFRVLFIYIFESLFSTIDEFLGVLNVAFVETTEISEEIFRENILNAHFGNSLIQRVDTSKRSSAIGIGVTVLTIQNARVSNHISTLLTLLADFITTENNEVRFEDGVVLFN